MKIKGIEGMTTDQVHEAVHQGARFVIFQYCISLLVISFKRPSAIYFIKDGESRSAKGMPYSVISFLFGWWGIPWGPIWTIASLSKNSSGGKNVTREVLDGFPPHSSTVTARPPGVPPEPRPIPTARQNRRL